MCQILKVVRSGYYAWNNREKSKRTIENEKILDEIKQSYEDSRGLYGSPRIYEDLKGKGVKCSKNRIARLMRINGIKANIKCKYKVYKSVSSTQNIAPNLLEQNFKTNKINNVWVSDITYIKTQEGWLYLATILDLCSRKIVGWSMSNRITNEIVIKAIKNALMTRKPKSGTMFHSDRGSQYTSWEVINLLKDNDFIQSMSSKGNCYDNAVMESFYHTLKTELVYLKNYETRDEASLSVFDYIETFYNRKRRHSSIEYLSPVIFEERYFLNAA